MKKNDELILFYDGDCAVCNRTVKFVLKNEINDRIRFSKLQSIQAKEFFELNNYPKIDLTTVYFYKNGKIYDKSNAILELSKNLRLPYSLLFVFKIIPKFIRDYCYTIFSKNRYRFNSDSCDISLIYNKSREL